MIVDEYNTRCQVWSDIQTHLPYLHDVAATGDATVIDLGVRSGFSTAAFLAAVEVNGGHVYSVDTSPVRVPWANHPQWTFIQGDDLWVADQLPDDVDVVFIDTSHTYRQTSAELEMYVPKVKAGGVVLLHDVELQHPDASPADDPPFPVRQAIVDFCIENGLTPSFVEGSFGLGVIRIGGDGGD
jgi:predicted O-methyltransferase YrrM